MTRQTILDLFRKLARSQGFYGRLLEQIELNPEAGDKYIDYILSQNPKEPIDVIMIVEY